jgi:SET domain-containing protein
MAKRVYQPGDFKLSVHRSRTGLGLFADQAIPKGACVIEYVGKELTDAEYDVSKSRYLFDLGDDKVLDGSPRWNRARYINHSCVPNCEPELHDRHVYIFALRDIAPGEELAYNYGKEYFDEWIGENCRCPKHMPDAPQQAAAAAAASYRPSKSAPAKR